MAASRHAPTTNVARDTNWHRTTERRNNYKIKSESETALPVTFYAPQRNYQLPNINVNDNRSRWDEVNHESNNKNEENMLLETKTLISSDRELSLPYSWESVYDNETPSMTRARWLHDNTFGPVVRSEIALHDELQRNDNRDPNSTKWQEYNDYSFTTTITTTITTQTQNDYYDNASYDNVNNNTKITSCIINEDDDDNNNQKFKSLDNKATLPITKEWLHDNNSNNYNNNNNYSECEKEELSNANVHKAVRQKFKWYKGDNSVMETRRWAQNVWDCIINRKKHTSSELFAIARQNRLHQSKEQKTEEFTKAVTMTTKQMANATRLEEIIDTNVINSNNNNSNAKEHKSCTNVQLDSVNWTKSSSIMLEVMKQKEQIEERKKVNMVDSYNYNNIQEADKYINNNDNTDNMHMKNDDCKPTSLLTPSPRLLSPALTPCHFSQLPSSSAASPQLLSFQSHHLWDDTSTVIGHIPRKCNRVIKRHVEYGVPDMASTVTRDEHGGKHKAEEDSENTEQETKEATDEHHKNVTHDATMQNITSHYTATPHSYFTADENKIDVDNDDDDVIWEDLKHNNKKVQKMKVNCKNNVMAMNDNKHKQFLETSCVTSNNQRSSVTKEHLADNSNSINSKYIKHDDNVNKYNATVLLCNKIRMSRRHKLPQSDANVAANKEQELDSVINTACKTVRPTLRGHGRQLHALYINEHDDDDDDSYEYISRSAADKIRLCSI